MLVIAKKTIFDLLAKSFHNNSIKQLVESLIDVLNRDDKLCVSFMEMLFEEDECDYVFDILLECTDITSRLYIAHLMKFLLNKLKVIEKDYINDTKKVTVTNEKGESETYDEYIALSSRFIMKALSLLKTKVAKNWAKFDYFLEVIYSFALETTQDSFLKTQTQLK